MKKNLFWAASIACLCASCANDAVIEENRASDEIRFSVRAEGNTRADAVYCPTVLPDEFIVYATESEAANPFIKEASFSKNGSAYTSSTTYYWPLSANTSDVTFEAIKGVAKKENLTDFTVKTNVSEQVDLIYARATSKKSSNPVALNFRHALSQIVFKASNSDETLTVNVTKIQVKNVYSKGTYTLPTANTSDNIAEGPDHAGTDITNAARGTWASQGTAASYSVTLDKTLTGLQSAQDLTSANTTTAMMLLPGTYAEASCWTPSDGKVSESSKVVFVVTAKITQKVGDGAEATIWNGDIAIPVGKIEWTEGKRYVYTLAFGQGNGIDPENPNNPVFIPISFSVTVDEFVNADETLDFKPQAAEESTENTENNDNNE